jgi:hypothetical protein
VLVLQWTEDDLGRARTRAAGHQSVGGDGNGWMRNPTRRRMWPRGRLLEAGGALGISQVESSGFRRLLTRAKDLAGLQSQHGEALRSVRGPRGTPGALEGRRLQQAGRGSVFRTRGARTVALCAPMANVLERAHGQVLYVIYVDTREKAHRLSSRNCSPELQSS